MHASREASAKVEPYLDPTVSNATLLRIKQHFPSSNADCPAPNNPISPPMPHALHQSVVSQLKPLLPHTKPSLSIPQGGTPRTKQFPHHPPTLYALHQTAYFHLVMSNALTQKTCCHFLKRHALHQPVIFHFPRVHDSHQAVSIPLPAVCALRVEVSIHPPHGAWLAPVSCFSDPPVDGLHQSVSLHLPLALHQSVVFQIHPWMACIKQFLFLSQSRMPCTNQFLFIS